MNSSKSQLVSDSQLCPLKFLTLDVCWHYRITSLNIHPLHQRWEKGNTPPKRPHTPKKKMTAETEEKKFLPANLLNSNNSTNSTHLFKNRWPKSRGRWTFHGFFCGATALRRERSKLTCDMVQGCLMDGWYMSSWYAKTSTLKWMFELDGHPSYYFKKWLFR